MRPNSSSVPTSRTTHAGSGTVVAVVVVLVTAMAGAASSMVVVGGAVPALVVDIGTNVVLLEV
jgi:hypothetical protein